MANLESFDKGSEVFKRKANAIVKEVNDHETRITKLEKGGPDAEFEFNGCENGQDATFYLRGRRGALPSSP